MIQDWEPKNISVLHNFIYGVTIGFSREKIWRWEFERRKEGRRIKKEALAQKKKKKKKEEGLMALDGMRYKKRRILTF